MGLIIIKLKTRIVTVLLLVHFTEIKTESWNAQVITVCMYIGVFIRVYCCVFAAYLVCGE